MIRWRIEVELERERERVKRLCHIYNDIISLENLLVSWQEFLPGKRKRKDVAEFAIHFMDNITVLHEELVARIYKHGEYEAFKINDPKPRDIHKASVRDRLLHHAIYRILYPYFDQKFIFDSYSCRNNKSTYRAINRLNDFCRKVSKNNTRTCWILKCDIRKFFANIDHGILKMILRKFIGDEDVLLLLEDIIESFPAGLPLGNLTSQLLVNIYMNEFDHFVKRRLKVKYYIRYADDFVIISEYKNYLEKLITEISEFLKSKLGLSLHPGKLYIKTLDSGVDFLGWVNFSKHRVLRTSTKRRMMRNLEKSSKSGVVISYEGLLSHGNTNKLLNKISQKQS